MHRSTDETATQPLGDRPDARASRGAVPVLRAALHVTLVSLRRLFWSRQTVVSTGLVMLACVGAMAWSRRRDPTVERFVEDIVTRAQVSFLLPILTLCYATAAVAGEREERTLVYLLLSPLARPVVYLAKYAAALILSLAWAMGAFAALAAVGGAAGRTAFLEFWPAIFLGTAAYTSLFHVFGVTFRRATIVAIGYSFFVETFLGHMPGIVKRTAIEFYVRCILYERGAAYGIGPRFPVMFQAVPGHTAEWILALASLALLVVGLWIFSRREYVDAS